MNGNATMKEHKYMMSHGSLFELPEQVAKTYYHLLS